MDDASLNGDGGDLPAHVWELKRLLQIGAELAEPLANSPSMTDLLEAVPKVPRSDLEAIVVFAIAGFFEQQAAEEAASDEEATDRFLSGLLAFEWESV